MEAQVEADMADYAMHHASWSVGGVINTVTNGVNNVVNTVDNGVNNVVDTVDNGVNGVLSDAEAAGCTAVQGAVDAPLVVFLLFIRK